MIQHPTTVYTFTKQHFLFFSSKPSHSQGQSTSKSGELSALIAMSDPKSGVRTSQAKARAKVPKKKDEKNDKVLFHHLQRWIFEFVESKHRGKKPQGLWRNAKIVPRQFGSLVLHESKKRVFGTDVTNISFKRNKVHSSNYLNFNQFRPQCFNIRCSSSLVTTLKFHVEQGASARNSVLKFGSVANIEETKEKIDMKPWSVSYYLDYHITLFFIPLCKTSDEFNAGHPPAAINIPYHYILKNGGEEMSLKNSKFLEEVSSEFGKEKKIIVGCKLGRRSLMATTDLLAAVSYNLKCTLVACETGVYFFEA
ncbi:hypothetical protein CRYUN_Cryun21dG0091400 [Craigia yunnanensis]